MQRKFKRSAHSARPGRGITKSPTFIETSSLKHLQIQKSNRKFNNSCTWGCLRPKFLRISSLVSPKGVPKRALCHPRGSQKGALVTQGGPKIDKNGSRDPFGTQVASMTVSGRRARDGGPPFFELPGRTWALQGPIWDPRGGSRKEPQIDMGG